MKNLCVFLPVLFFSLSLFGQTFDLSITKDSLLFSHEGEIKHGYAYLENPFADSIHVDIIRVEENYYPDWINGMCADTICYFISTDSIRVIIPPNGSVEFRPGFTLINDTTSQVGEVIFDMKNKTDSGSQVITHGFYAFNNNIILADEDLILYKKTKVYPNPTSGIIQIESPSMVNKISIFDWSGRLVFEIKGDQKSIDISFLEKGGYVMKIDYETGNVIKRIVKL